ncbi:MAG: hypothetical protein IJK63_01410 [Oscillospiraceae bacterium]|nr:hypothetical protein [Oscillospiraceae bacterium]
MRRLRLLLLVFFLAVFAVFMASNIREYLTSDYVAPEIRAESDTLQVSVTATDEELLAGIVAEDNLDGDVTDSLVVVSKSKFIARNTRNVNYAAFDENNNVGTYTRKIVYTDYFPPRFVMTEPLRFVEGNSNYDYLRYIRASDCLDGNLTTQIKITFGEKEITSEYGSTQKINLQVTNSAGDTSVLELTASFEDYDSYSKASPALSNYIIYVKKGEKPNYRSYLDGIWSAGNHRKFSDLGFDPDQDVKIVDSGVDLNVPGVYTVTYKLSRSSPNATGGSFRTDFGTATLVVVVEDRP